MSDLSDPTALRDEVPDESKIRTTPEETRRSVAIIVDQHLDSKDSLFEACVTRLAEFVTFQQRAAAHGAAAELDGLRAQIEEARTMPHDINCAWLGDPDENPCDCYLSLLAQSPRGTVARIHKAGYDTARADAILAAPSLSLVAVRDEMARTLAEAMAYERYPDQTVIDNPDVIEVMIPAAERGADALFASGILKPSSEVEAAVLREVRSWIVVRSGFDMPRSELDAYDQKYDVRMHPQKSKHAARVRSGKDEA